MSFIVKLAKNDIYPEFEQLQKRFKYLGAEEVRVDPSVTKELFQEYVANESMMAAYLDGALIGYAFLDAFYDNQEEVVCSIREIFVAPEYQRNGYGKEMVRKIREEAKKIGAKKLLVFSVFIETDNFWMRSCGFEGDKSGYLVQEIK